ncbi:MAG: hypothetical protein FWG68_05110 [Defluviitaleaceae bacterium]|nr:hypothetical protein [Defluviitaleaceae bacterium]
MIDLYNYRFQNVKIIDIDGNTHTGFVEYYTPAINDPDNTENIAIRPPNTTGYVVGFTAADISNIEIIGITPSPQQSAPPLKELQPA